MSDETLTGSPGLRPNTIKADDGRVLEVSAGWELLPPGDAGLTRRVKAAGPSWTVREKRGRKMFSRGVWAPAEHIHAEKAGLDRERATPAYAKRKKADATRREAKQEVYVDDFRSAVLGYLAFAPCYGDLAGRLAEMVAAHATPVGSGTVARTERIPIEQRAAAAVTAWMRHQTTAYDTMRIARVKGERREVRKMLARRSREVLERYRRGEPADPACPLALALAKRAA